MAVQSPVAPDVRRTMIAALLLGIGFMAAIDEIVFHQLLAWHHFVDRGSSALALASDGMLHAGELVLLIAGFFMMIELHGRRAQAPGYRSAGFLLGMGGFQTFDGIVNHKLLGLHQVRYVDNLWLYDLAWIGAGLMLLVLGWFALKKAQRGSASTQDR